MSEARRAAFSALLSCYHNSFANVREGRIAHSPEFVRKVLSVCEAKKAKQVLASDPRLTSTDEGAIAVGIAKAIMVSERVSRSFIDVEINEGGTYVVTFDKDLKSEDGAAACTPVGTVAVLCKPDDLLGEGIKADCTIVLVEPTAQVAESFLPAKSEKSDKTVAEDAAAVSSGQPGLTMTVNGITYSFDAQAGWKLADSGKSIDIKSETGLRDLLQALRADVPLARTPNQFGDAVKESVDVTSADIRSLYCYAYGEKSFETVGESTARASIIDLVEHGIAKFSNILGIDANVPKDTSVDSLISELGESTHLAAFVKAAAFDPSISMPDEALTESFNDDLRKALIMRRAAKNLLFAAGSVPAELSESLERLVAFIRKNVAKPA